MVTDSRTSLSKAVIAALLALVCACMMPIALAETAESGALSVDFTIEPGTMVEPGDVTMTFVLENKSGQDVQNVYISSEDGLFSEPVGQIRSGERQTLVRPHTVTQEELDEGAIRYTVSHDSARMNGEKVTYTITAQILRGKQEPGVSFTRQMSSNFVTAGGQVTITYKITNTGNVALNTLRIRDALGDFTGRLEQLDVGEVRTFISRVTLEEAARSAPVLEYAEPSGQEYALSLDPADIGIADTELDISFTVNTPKFGEDTADVRLVLSNLGDVDYTDITIVDDVYHGVIADAVDLPAGGRATEIMHTYPVRGTGEYRWRITGMNDAGQRLDLLTDTLTVEEAAEGQQADIVLKARTSTPRINRAGRVTFDFSITNSGTGLARDARLYELNRGDIRRLAVIPAGAPTECSASYDVTADTEFIFCLSYVDAMGRQRNDSFAPITVAIAADGVAPQSAQSPEQSIRGQSVKPGGSSSSLIVLMIVAGAALTVMITLLVVTSVRSRRERLRRLAAEKQRIKAELGKTGSIPVVKNPPRRNTK